MEHLISLHTALFTAPTCIETEIARLPSPLHHHGFDWSYSWIKRSHTETNHTQLPYFLRQLWATRTSSEKLEHRGFLGAIFHNDPTTGTPRRQKALLSRIGLIFLDYDEGDTLHSLDQWLNGDLLSAISVILHSTFRDGTFDPDTDQLQTRFRVIIPLSRSIDLDEYQRIMAHLTPQLGTLDGSSKRATQLMMGPRTNPESQRNPWLHVRP